MTIHEIPLLVSSSTSEGALNVSSDGSSFEVILEDPLRISDKMKSCTVEVHDGTVWWTIPNISSTLGNNKFYLEHLTVNYVITLQDGLYSLAELNASLDREIEVLTGLSGLVTLESDDATQKVNIQVNQIGSRIDFTQSDTFRSIIGFSSKLVPTLVSTGVYNELATSVASFNSISYFLLHSDIVTRGMRVNNQYNQTIARILIDETPGSQILFRPYNPLKIGAWDLMGATRNRIKFWLTDQDNNAVNTNGEIFSAIVVIKYSD